MIASYTVPPIYAAFVWWFSTGAVLLLVGRSGRFEVLRALLAVVLLAGSLGGLALTAGDTSIGGAYTAFTCTILLWGAQEIAFLAGWLTGPRPRPCPVGVTGWKRLSYALQAILYHEFALLACGCRGRRADLERAQPGRALDLRGALGAAAECQDQPLPRRSRHQRRADAGCRAVPEELLCPQAGQRILSDSVTLATAVLVILIQRIVEVAATPFDIVGLTLVSTLFALGVVEHWFMLLPLAGDHAVGLGHALRFPAGGHHHGTGTRHQGHQCSAQSRRACERAPRSGASETGASGLRPAAA